MSSYVKVSKSTPPALAWVFFFLEWKKHSFYSPEN